MRDPDQRPFARTSHQVHEEVHGFVLLSRRDQTADPAPVLAFQVQEPGDSRTTMEAGLAHPWRLIDNFEEIPLEVPTLDGAPGNSAQAADDALRERNAPFQRVAREAEVRWRRTGFHFHRLDVPATRTLSQFEVVFFPVHMRLQAAAAGKPALPLLRANPGRR